MNLVKLPQQEQRHPGSNWFVRYVCEDCGRKFASRSHTEFACRASMNYARIGTAVSKSFDEGLERAGTSAAFFTARFPALVKRVPFRYLVHRDRTDESVYVPTWTARMYHIGRRLGLSCDDVAFAIRLTLASDLDIPLRSLHRLAGDAALRARLEGVLAEQFPALPLAKSA